MTGEIRAFSKVLSNSYDFLRQVQKAGKGKEEVPHDVVREVLTGWGQSSLDILNVELEVKGLPSATPSLYIGNHISYLDIPLLMSQTPVMFVAKQELASWPIFGTGIKKLGMVLVERDSANSRNRAAEAIASCVLKRNHNVAIFPSGTTCLTEKKAWRWGAFLIAKRYGIPVQPFRINYTPLREVAYIDKDIFLPHLWRVAGLKKIRATLEFHDPVMVDDPQEECLRWWQWSQPSPSSPTEDKAIVNPHTVRMP